MKYLLDSNTFIQAKNFYYGMDICPAYWDWLDQQFQLGIVASVHMIGQELRDGNDELALWVKARPIHFISNSDSATQAIFTQIVQTIMVGNYNPGNRDDFLAKADPWLIAKARNIGATVVTNEVMVASNAKRVKIPNICQQFNVPYLTTFQFLRDLEAKFVLAQ